MFSQFDTDMKRTDRTVTVKVYGMEFRHTVT